MKRYVFARKTTQRTLIHIICFAMLIALAGCATGSLLYQASERGDIETVRTLLEGKTKTDLDKEEALYAAALGGNPEIVRLLIAKGADVNFCRERGWEPLLAAAYKGHADIVRILIDAGADVNATDNDNRGALHRAVMYGHADIVRILIDAGADVNVRSSFTGAAPIHWAAQDGRIDLVKMLLDAGADPSVEGVQIGGYSGFGQEGISVLRKVQQERTLTASKQAVPELVSKSQGYQKPEILILNPPIRRGISVIGRTSVTIRGRVEDVYAIDWVTINGQDAALNRGGFFELTVSLNEGKNSFLIKAMNKKGVSEEKVIVLSRKIDETPGPSIKPSLVNIYAVLIGINNYQDERISDLMYAEQDAKALYKFVIDPQRGGLLPKRVRLLTGDSATAVAIEKNLRQTLQASSPGDLIIIYMATHGLPDPEGGPGLFFLAIDSNLDSLLKTSISKADLERILSRYVANRKIVLITDACHAGGVGMSSQLMAFNTRGIQQRTFRLLNKMATSHDGLGILSASRANELSQESSKWGGGHGVFTYYLIRGLSGEADKNPSDGFVTLREIRDYVYDNVSQSTTNLQTPELIGNYDPNLPIAIVK